MNVDAVCPSCRTVFTVRREIVGKRTKCTACGKPFVIEEIRREFASHSSATVASAPPPADPIMEPVHANENGWSELRDFIKAVTDKLNQRQSMSEQASVPRMKEYKVLSQKDKWFSGKFDPANLEKALNEYAEQGWRVIAVTTASITGFVGANRDELIVVLER